MNILLALLMYVGIAIIGLVVLSLLLGCIVLGVIYSLYVMKKTTLPFYTTYTFRNICFIIAGIVCVFMPNTFFSFLMIWALHGHFREQHLDKMVEDHGDTRCLDSIPTEYSLWKKALSGCLFCPTYL